MSSFLHLLAKDIIQKFDYEFEQLTIIFPNKRAGLFLAHELAALVERPVWMPEIITMSEFVEKQTGFKKAEDIILITKLYKVYTEISGSQEKFDDFYYWGNMLLNDFDDIDKHLVNAKMLFSNLVALKEIEEHFPYLSDEQADAIKSFWKTFDTSKYSNEQQEFLNVWKNLYATYTNFKSTLQKQNLCYEGMGVRHYYENIEEYESCKNIIFAGFNAVNQCEKQIFTHFRNLEKAYFYWDYDTYYLSNDSHEAGHFIRENLKLFPNELGQEHFSNFKFNNKKVEYISVPSAIGQAKIIPELLHELPDCDNINTAIVLGDEKLLLPVIHSIPENISKVNITMGYPAQNTSVSTLIYLLGELKKNAKRENNENYYYYKPVSALLNHKLIKETCAEDVDKTLTFISENNIIYVPASSLRFNDITTAIFSSEEEKAINYILKVLGLFTLSSDAIDALQPVETEFIFTLYTLFQSLQNTFIEESIEPDDKLYIQILQKIIYSTSIPFSGEPLEGLQVMGVLETRLLDFKNLVILSANEGTLPKTTYPSSFIPYNLRIGFKLPTPEYQDALYAYNFYRMLQRAENIKLLYTSGVKNMNSGEMSRYLYQMKYESQLEIIESNFQNTISVQDTVPISIPQNEATREALFNLCHSPQNAFSPSALSIYLDCSLKFYFKYIANIREKDEIAEELDHRLLGNIFHKTSESLYSLLLDQEITAEKIDRIYKNDLLIKDHIQKAYLEYYSSHVAQMLDSSSNELILQIIGKYVRQMLQYDKQFTPFRIISLEKRYVFPLDIKVENEAKRIFIGGIIDRIDQTNGTIRIIDYKTGADQTTFKNVASVFDTNDNNRNKAAFQTMLYCLMFGHDYQGGRKLSPGIYSTKLLFNKDFNHTLKCNGELVKDFNTLKEEYSSNLTQLLEGFLSNSHTFSQSKNENKCRSCSYSGICNR